MTEKVYNFENIPSRPETDAILARMGYHRELTRVNARDGLLINEGIQQGLAFCNNKGAYRRCKLSEIRDERIHFGAEHHFQSASLARMLRGSREVVLMAATVGPEITRAIAGEMAAGSPFRAVVFDAVASEAADAILDWMKDFIDKILLREGKKLTRHRFSPGYGDLRLENQRIIFDLLNLSQIGLKLTETYILVPEKSVLAVAGVEGIESNG